MSGVGGETIIGEEGPLAELAGPVMSGVCVGCGGRDLHWRGIHACRAGRSSDEWGLCRVWGGETIIGEEDTLAELCVMSGVCIRCGGRDHHVERKTRCAELAGPVMSGVCVGCGGARLSLSLAYI